MEGRRQVYYRCWQVEATRIKSAQGRHSFSFGWLPTKNVVTDPQRRGIPSVLFHGGWAVRHRAAQGPPEAAAGMRVKKECL
ncbi:MAG: hypothetical protein BWY17_02839 [Deltaproteobacteria bacterium ADurb.Bin207]|jgi:hypothetical protein|nr:MAG: hypothetical protein BWY17_02839 [Deltaproteobacteria bacterium ADurb.Bin207]